MIRSVEQFRHHPSQQSKRRRSNASPAGATPQCLVSSTDPRGSRTIPQHPTRPCSFGQHCSQGHIWIRRKCMLLQVESHPLGIFPPQFQETTWAVVWFKQGSLSIVWTRADCPFLQARSLLVNCSSASRTRTIQERRSSKCCTPRKPKKDCH